MGWFLRPGFDLRSCPVCRLGTVRVWNCPEPHTECAGHAAVGDESRFVAGRGWGTAGTVGLRNPVAAQLGNLRRLGDKRTYLEGAEDL